MKKDTLKEMIDTLESCNKELEERKNECGDAICKAWYEGKIAANNEAIEVAKHLIAINTLEYATYYISIERQGSIMWIVKVNASSREEAEAKALKAVHLNDDITEEDEDTVKDMLQNGDIDFVIDEEGDEIDIDEED